jgi:CMP-N-acetylneuraminic acid synthetase
MTIIIIPAKAQSGRLKNKNMHILAGRPMIDWTISYALNSQSAFPVFVSSDSTDILEHAESMGVGLIPRPKHLLGETPILEVYKHAVKYLESNGLFERVVAVIGLQPDHPDRTISLDHAYDFFTKNQLDQLFTCDSTGLKNGSHYIISRHCLDGNLSRKDATITDDCTNIHFHEDLALAEANLKKGTCNYGD